MAIVTLRPDSTYVNTMPVVPGGGTAHGALNDNSDSSYIEAPWGSFTQAIVNIADYTIPANQFLKQVRVRVRYRTIALFGGGVTYWVVRFVTSTGGYGTSQSQSTTSSTPVESVGGWQTKAPSGADWNQTELNNLQVDIYPGYYSGVVQMPRVYEVYVDLDLNTSPTTTTTAPTHGGSVTTTTRPAFTFTYSDADGDAMEGYRAKLFHSDTYNAGGFDPNTWGALYDTGKIGAYSPPPGGIVAPFDLLNGASYRWYVWVYQAGGPQGTTGFGVSSPAYTQFTLNVTPPALPIVNPSAHSTGGYINLSILSGGGTPATSTILVQRSQDDGVTWSNVRGTPIVPNTTVIDFEAIPNKAVIYRGRSTAANGVASVWSAPTTPVTAVDNEWRLRDPLDSTRNIVLSVIGDNVSHRIPEDKAFFSPMGRTRKVSVADVIRGNESELQLEFLTEAAWLAFEKLRNSQRTLFLTRGWTGEAWYIQFDQILEMTIHNYFPTYRTVTISWIEMDAP